MHKIVNKSPVYPLGNLFMMKLLNLFMMKLLILLDSPMVSSLSVSELLATRGQFHHESHSRPCVLSTSRASSGCCLLHLGPPTKTPAHSALYPLVYARLCTCLPHVSSRAVTLYLYFII